jgi:hypothetical protein
LPRSSLVSVVALGACALSLCVARPARAQNPAAAEALFEQARAAMAAGDYDLACARFKDSDRLDPAIGTRFNLADCEERRGRVATAWSLFRGVHAELSAGDDRKPIAEQRAKALEPRLPYVTMTRTAETPPGMLVRIDGAELGEGSFGVALPLDPGQHELVLRSPSANREERSSFTLREGQHASVPLRFKPATPSAPRAVPSEPSEPSAPIVSVEQSPPGTAQRRWGYVVGGVGAAGVVVGAITGLMSLNKRNLADDHCSDQRRVCDAVGVEANRDGKNLALVSGVGFGAGAIGLAVGAVLVLTAPLGVATSAHSHLPAPATASINPQLVWSNGTGFIAVSGSF